MVCAPVHVKTFRVKQLYGSVTAGPGPTHQAATLDIFSGQISRVRKDSGIGGPFKT